MAGAIRLEQNCGLRAFSAAASMSYVAGTSPPLPSIHDEAPGCGFITKPDLSPYLNLLAVSSLLTAHCELAT
jgi:hypothetical protein